MIAQELMVNEASQIMVNVQYPRPDRQHGSVILRVRRSDCSASNF